MLRCGRKSVNEMGGHNGNEVGKEARGEEQNREMKKQTVNARFTAHLIGGLWCKE
jgi:hypothetical protein